MVIKTLQRTVHTPIHVHHYCVLRSSMREHSITHLVLKNCIAGDQVKAMNRICLVAIQMVAHVGSNRIEMIPLCVFIHYMSILYSNTCTFLLNCFRKTMQVRRQTPMLETRMKTQTGGTGAIKVNICCR